MGVNPSKPELPAESVRQFEHFEAGPQIVKLKTGILVPGEYVFLLIGSGEPAKGSQGKGYDFAIEAPATR